MKSHILHAALLLTALTSVSAIAQTTPDPAKQPAQSLSHSDPDKQPAQSLSHSDPGKQRAQSLAHSDATKQKTQSLSHADPGAGVTKQQ
jgi:hypothetical protein